ncbi:alpha/beta hydrolase family protein [Aeromonas caviae]
MYLSEVHAGGADNAIILGQYLAKIIINKRTMIAQFAGQGYLLIGADYFGLGISTEPEGYMVKGSHQQATFDLLMASRAVLEQMKLDSHHLFLAGWSQGGFVTMAFLEKLEATGIKVDAAVTASAPLDVYALMQGFLVYPRRFDALWLNSIMILSSFAYEHYYGVKLPRMIDQGLLVGRRHGEHESVHV